MLPLIDQGISPPPPVSVTFPPTVSFLSRTVFASVAVTFPLTVMVVCPVGSAAHGTPANLPIVFVGWQPMPRSEPAAAVTLCPTVIVDGALCASSTAPAATLMLPTTLITASGRYVADAGDRDAGVVPGWDVTTGARVRHRAWRGGHRRSSRERERRRNGEGSQDPEACPLLHEHYPFSRSPAGGAQLAPDAFARRSTRVGLAIGPARGLGDRIGTPPLVGLTPRPSHPVVPGVCIAVALASSWFSATCRARAHRVGEAVRPIRCAISRRVPEARPAASLIGRSLVAGLSRSARPDDPASR